MIGEKHADAILERLDRIAALLDAQGRRVQPELQVWPFNVNAAGFNLLIEGQPGQRIFVCSFLLSAAGAVTATFGSGDGLTFSAFSGKASTGRAGDLVLATGAPAAAAASPPFFLFRTEAGAPLALNLSGAVAVGGYLTYWKA